VRHADDHIHLVATLVRQDRRTAWAWQDKLNTQRICRELEERYNLYRVAPPGQGPRRWPTPAELNKTTRLNQQTTTTTAAGVRTSSRRGASVPPREHLRRQVRRVAAAASSETDFFTRLEHAGVTVRQRYSTRRPGEVTGYAVGMDGHVTAGGETVWYGGGKLAADLTLPRLRNRWGGPDAPPETGGGPARLAALSRRPSATPPPHYVPPGTRRRRPGSPRPPPTCSPPPPTGGKVNTVGRCPRPPNFSTGWSTTSASAPPVGMCMRLGCVGWPASSP
jgi:hypothetical protein